MITGSAVADPCSRATTMRIYGGDVWLLSKLGGTQIGVWGREGDGWFVPSSS